METTAVPQAGSMARVDAARLLEQSPGAKSLYRVLGTDDRSVFAARWIFDSVHIASGHMRDAVLSCRIAGSAIVVRGDAGSVTRRRPCVGSVTFLDPDAPATWCSEGSAEVCHVYLSRDDLRRCAEADFGWTGEARIRPLFGTEDPWLKGYFQMLVSEFDLLAEGSERADPLFIEQAEHLLMNHLLRRHAGTAMPDPAGTAHSHAANPLPAAALRHVEEYVAAHLTHDIRLADMASVACMSVGHFMRGFRAASGTTPHRYVLDQRLARARHLLRTTGLPIAQIAIDCGFKTPSHLSAKFRACTGISPSAYRRSS
jgi:AraC family transcriptional regulator